MTVRSRFCAPSPSQTGLAASISSKTCCGNTFGLPTPQGRCNQNQDSQPFTAPDGTLYIVYNNFNNTATGTDNRNQVLLARSTDGGETFSAPVKVADYYELPDCDTYQGAGADPGRACVPETGTSSNSVFRATNYPIGGVDPTNPNRVVVTFGSYINRDSNEHRGCTPAGFAADGINIYTGVKTGGCNNDILYSVSTDRAGSFSGTVIDPRQLPVVTDGAKQSSTDQFWQAATFTTDGILVASYYDRSYRDDNATGYSDITVSASHETTRRTPAAVPVSTSRSRKLSSGRKLAFTAQTFHSSALSCDLPTSSWTASLRTARNSSSVSAV